MTAPNRRVPIAATLVALAVSLPAGLAPASSSSRAPAVRTATAPTASGALAVRLKSSPARAERSIAALARRTDGDVTERLPEISAAVVRPAAGQTLAEARAELAADPAVAAVTNEHVAYPRYIPNDPYFNTRDSTANAPNGDFAQWYLRSQNFPAGWDASRGTGAMVAIIDSGIDSTHPDLGAKIVAAVAQSGTGTNDTDGHGTHVAGLACAASDNGIGIAASGLGCGLIVEKASHPPNVGIPILNPGHDSTWFTDGEIAASVIDATDRGAAAINMSLGGASPLPQTREAIDYAWSHGSIPVVAAENCAVSTGSAPQGYPAQYVQPQGSGPDINRGQGLVVTASEYDRTRADFSTSPAPPDCPNGAGFGTGVSVAAMGDSSVDTAGILSTYTGGSYRYLLGTSMAAPQVSGLVALIRSAFPGLPAAEIVRAVKLSASGGGSFSAQLGWGIIDAGAALRQTTIAHDFRRPSSRVKSRKRTRKRRFWLRITTNDSASPGLAAAGVQNVEIYVSKGRQRFRLLAETTTSAIKFRGKRGKRYRFYTRAVDAAGNREAAPGSPDTVTRILRRR